MFSGRTTNGQPVKYRVLFMDAELPGVAPAHDNGWNSVYTSPCSGVTRASYVPANVDRADFNGFWDYVSTHGYTPGVYSEPGVWASIFGGVTASSPHALMWQWSGGGGVSNGVGDFDQIDTNVVR